MTATAEGTLVTRARAATPGTSHAHHLNAAGAALPSAAVLEAVVEHLRLEARIGGYEAAALARPRLERCYDLAAALLGGEAADIALTESATVSWHRAVDALALRPGDRVIATSSSYVSSALHLMELRRTRGITVDVIGTDATGAVDLDAMEAALGTPAALVTAAHVPTSSGLVEPVRAIGALASAAGVPFLLDATQSLGHLPVDVAAIGCQMLVGTGRKFIRAPRGTGLLWVDPAFGAGLRPSAPDVRGAEWIADQEFAAAPGARRFETWEAAHALRLGLATALEEALGAGVDIVHEHVSALGHAMRAALADVPGVRVVDPPAAGGGIVTFVREDEPAAATASRLRAAGVHVVAVPAAHGRWDLGRRGIDAVVRASMHVYNSDDDLDALVDAVTRPAPRRPRKLPERVDVVVVGAGVHGSSAAWRLAARGAEVLHLERSRPGHGEGSSHGPTRMIRRAYASPVWDGLVERAYAGWADLARESGRTLLTTTGGIYAHPVGTTGMRGPGCRVVDHARAAEIAPGLALGPDFEALHDPGAGVLDAEGALTALAELGRRYGVQRRDETPVLGWEPDGDGVIVRTPVGDVRAERLVLCAGPWIGDLVPAFAGLLNVVRIVNVHVGSSNPAMLAPPALGAFSVDVPDVGLIYGIPAIGGHAVKVGLDHGPADDPATPPGPVTLEEREVLRALAHRFLPAADGPVVEDIACRYTLAPRYRFAVGPLPATPQVLVAAACSGHGFKFGPAIGEALADLAHGVARPDLAFLDPAEMLGRA
ncbi:aminotransferase class V-fold PLP-dependent enzyme [Pseudonocardia sp. DSM 110487]|uniref:FAD-dependent oxidoreductase n=1 Tax=Pseudonocardia sp. DSM 110487 TaxID=2865833 RepID=UPI001C69DC8E|nr:FAD-dependent oxidoreductase [Pseudonocardia sp. DSM 110487]QYN39476.1 aminotransferase class V-fold PLP-dependent enzyme [Pseudonocardia sp. DSM 110487]